MCVNGAEMGHREMEEGIEEGKAEKGWANLKRLTGRWRLSEGPKQSIEEIKKRKSFLIGNCLVYLYHTHFILQAVTSFLYSVYMGPISVSGQVSQWVKRAYWSEALDESCRTMIQFGYSDSFLIQQFCWCNGEDLAIVIWVVAEVLCYFLGSVCVCVCALRNNAEGMPEEETCQLFPLCRKQQGDRQREKKRRILCVVVLVCVYACVCVFCICATMSLIARNGWIWKEPLISLSAQ